MMVAIVVLLSFILLFQMASYGNGQNVYKLMLKEREERRTAGSPWPRREDV